MRVQRNELFTNLVNICQASSEIHQCLLYHMRKGAGKPKVKVAPKEISFTLSCFLQIGIEDNFPLKARLILCILNVNSL